MMDIIKTIYGKPATDYSKEELLQFLATAIDEGEKAQLQVSSFIFTMNKLQADNAQLSGFVFVSVWINIILIALLVRTLFLAA